MILADGCNIDQKFFGHKAAFFSILTNFTPFCRYHWAKSEYSQLGLSSEMPKYEICLFFYYVWLLNKRFVFGSFWKHALRNSNKPYILGFNEIYKTVPFIKLIKCVSFYAWTWTWTGTWIPDISGTWNQIPGFSQVWIPGEDPVIKFLKVKLKAIKNFFS